MSVELLTDSKIRALKPHPAPFELLDRSQTGLTLRVSANGKKTWFLLTRIKGTLRRVKIGTYPEITLTAAREEARRQKARIQLGADIWLEKKGGSNQLRFDEFAERFLSEHSIQKADSGKEDRRKIEKHLIPLWGKVSVNEITKTHVHIVIDQLLKADTRVMPNRVLQLIKTMFTWGLEKDLVASNPAEHIRKPKKEKSRDVYLNEVELRMFWRALEKTTSQVRDFFQLCILMGQRAGREMGHLRWREIDFNTGLALISFERMKNRVSQEIPVSSHAAAILSELKKQAGVSPFVFPSPIDPIGRPMTYPKKRFLKIKLQSGIEKDFHVHDLRHTVDTLMASRLKIPKTVREKILSHKSAKEISDVYDQHDYLDEKKDALERWGEFIFEVTKC